MRLIKTIAIFLVLLPLAGFTQEFLIKEPDTSAKVFKNWATQCETEPKSKKEICYSSQTIVLKDKDVEILYIAIGYVPESDKPLMRLTTPLGTLLPEGVTLKVDKGEESRLPFIFCNRIGCHIEVGVADKFLNAVKSGKKLNIKFLDLGGRSFEVPVSLSGFTRAFNSIKK